MSNCLALIVAAGAGSRFAASVPKQYADIGGRPMLWYSLRAFCGHDRIARTFVILDPTDETYERHDWGRYGAGAMPMYCGGTSRAASVRQGLEGIAGHVALDDWILVHDAARPCVSKAAIDRLIDTLVSEEAGGLLAIPVSDTLKRDDGQNRVLRTESRDQLWQAQTPQMFRYEILLKAMQSADPQNTTDEASAVEQMGFKPRLVLGSPANMKITYPEDLALATAVIEDSGQ
jgi:2-C-methyl-D-erythritol 4-phosphate cytidylyltransferase